MGTKPEGHMGLKKHSPCHPTSPTKRSDNWFVWEIDEKSAFREFKSYVKQKY